MINHILRLKSLKPGIYIGMREVERDNFSAPKTGKEEMYVFQKTDEDYNPYYIVGSERGYDETGLLRNNYGEFTPIRKINKI